MNPYHDICSLFELASAGGRSREEVLRSNFGVETHFRTIVQSGDHFRTPTSFYSDDNTGFQYRVFYYRGIVQCTQPTEFYSGGCEVRHLSTGNRQFVLTKYADILPAALRDESQYDILDDSAIILGRYYILVRLLRVLSLISLFRCSCFNTQGERLIEAS